MKRLILKDHIGNVYRKIYEDFKPYKFRLDGAPVTSKIAFRDALYGNNAVNHRGLSMWFPVELKTEKRTVYVVIYTDQNNRRVKHLYYQDTEPKGGEYYHRARINVENGKIIRRKKEVEYAE